jgi:hypothetical protein
MTKFKYAYFLYSTSSLSVLGPTQPPIQWVPVALSPGEERGIKRLGSEADHSPPFSAEVKNGGSMHPLLHKSYWHSS